MHIVAIYINFIVVLVELYAQSNLQIYFELTAEEGRRFKSTVSVTCEKKRH